MSRLQALWGWFDSRMPSAAEQWKIHASEYYAPKNFNFWYYFGSLALLILVMQIVTGILLTMHYKPDAGQAAVCVAHATIRRADKLYAVGRVANGVLGEGYSARMNQEVRIKRGLSYGAGSSLGTRKESGLFLASAQTRNDAAAEVAVLLKGELGRLASEPVAAAELVPRKAALSGNYARELETGAGLVSAVASLTAYELPLSSLNDYLPQVEKVTAAEIRTFATKHLGAGDANVIIVGDGRQFLPELKKRFPKVEVLAVDKLDLNKAGLVK